MERSMATTVIKIMLEARVCHDEFYQKTDTQKDSASHRPHACLGKEDRCTLCHAQPAACLDGQSVSTKPNAEQAAHASVTSGQLKTWLWHWTNACQPAMIIPQVGPIGGCRPRGSGCRLVTLAHREAQHAQQHQLSVSDLTSRAV